MIENLLYKSYVINYIISIICYDNISVIFENKVSLQYVLL